MGNLSLAEFYQLVKFDKELGPLVLKLIEKERIADSKFEEGLIDLLDGPGEPFIE